MGKEQNRQGTRHSKSRRFKIFSLPFPWQSPWDLREGHFLGGLLGLWECNAICYQRCCGSTRQFLGSSKASVFQVLWEMPWVPHCISEILKFILVYNLHSHKWKTMESFYLKNVVVFIKLRGRERERERETLAVPCTPCIGDGAQNPGMCSGQELNWWHLGLWDDAQPAEPLPLGGIFVGEEGLQLQLIL